MGIAVLGPLAVDGATGRLRHHDRVVLTVLAMRPGETVPADRLADALWGGRVPETWDKVVQGCVVRLRKALGAGAIETTPHGYRLMLPADEIDSLRFEHLVGRSRELLALAEPDRAATDDLVALWQFRADGTPVVGVFDSRGRERLLLEGSRSWVVRRWGSGSPRTAAASTST